MKKNAQYAHIPQINGGVAFSDPFYDDTVWCQYRKAFRASDWLMKMETSRDEDNYINIALSLGRPTMIADTQISHETDGSIQFTYPRRYDTSEAEIGMDTACVFVGSLDNFSSWGDSAAINTGTDGLFGNLYELTCKGENIPAGYILLGAIDGDLINEEELYRSFVSSFDGKEIDKARYDELTDKNSLAFRVQLSSEVQLAANAVDPQTKQPHAKDEPER